MKERSVAGWGEEGLYFANSKFLGQNGSFILRKLT